MGAAIRGARGGEKLETIARRAKLSVSALSRLERGERSEGLELLFRVLATVGLDVDVVPRRGAQGAPTPEAVVEDALSADPQLFDHSREVVLAAYRRAREDGTARARPKKERAAASR